MLVACRMRLADKDRWVCPVYTHQERHGDDGHAKREACYGFQKYHSQWRFQPVLGVPWVSTSSSTNPQRSREINTASVFCAVWNSFCPITQQAIPVKKDEKKVQLQEVEAVKEAALEASKHTVCPAIVVPADTGITKGLVDTILSPAAGS